MSAGARVSVIVFNMKTNNLRDKYLCYIAEIPPHVIYYLVFNFVKDINILKERGTALANLYNSKCFGLQ